MNANEKDEGVAVNFVFLPGENEFYIREEKSEPI